MSETGGGAAAVVLGGEAVAATEAAAARAHRTIVALSAMLGYQGFTMAINGVGSPWIAQSFHLGESGIAGLYAWIATAALGVLLLSRLADRIGRRRVLLLCITATPVCALAAALSTNIVWFAISEILLSGFIGATVNGAMVMLAEELPIAQRSTGQGYAGLAVALGNGVCVIVLPLLTNAGYSWRSALLIAAGGLVGVPFVARIIPESQRWERAAASGATRATRFVDVFAPRYRRRAVPITACVLLSTIANTAAMSWSYFHAVSVVHLSPGAASVMTLLGGGVGVLGFPLGAWGCERFGRVPTVVTFGLLACAGALWFYWGPPPHFAHPAVWLGVAFCWLTGAANASTVGGNSAVTELFPTALRGTMIGWFALITAVGAVAAQSGIAVLAGPLGGLSNVVGFLALLSIPSVTIFGLFVDETRGLSLEVAAQERRQ